MPPNLPKMTEDKLITMYTSYPLYLRHVNHPNRYRPQSLDKRNPILIYFEPEEGRITLFCALKNVLLNYQSM